MPVNFCREAVYERNGRRTAGSSAGTQASTREFPREGCEPAIAIGTQKLGPSSHPLPAPGSALCRTPRRAGGTRGPSERDRPFPTGFLQTAAECPQPHPCPSPAPSPRRRGSAFPRRAVPALPRAPSPHSPGSRAGGAGSPRPRPRPSRPSAWGRAWIWRESIKSRREARPPSCQSRGRRLGQRTMINPNYYPWGYDGDNGPDQWHKNYPFAKGRHQSPIEINNKDVHYDSSLLPWFASYDPGAAKTILNNGKTCRVVFDDSFDRSVLRGGPLPGVYRLRQLHFHWGSSDDHGSEHVVNGVRYAGELHLLHWNPKYSNYLDAKRRTDGIAVLAIFLQVGETPKPEMKRILEEINAIKTKGKNAPFPNFDPSILFPKSHDYWTYHGSVTTPPCEECVTWIILREPIIVSSDQMAKLRSLSKNAENEPSRPLVDNWRPTQPRYFRMVSASFL
uniref:Carbonic anhydrase n=2 Tax=Ficedula albicollis TaxID=59894 RepID=U3JQR5_FICAL